MTSCSGWPGSWRKQRVPGRASGTTACPRSTPPGWRQREIVQSPGEPPSRGPDRANTDPAAFLEAADLRSPDYANESGQPIGVSIVHVNRTLQILRSGE